MENEKEKQNIIKIIWQLKHIQMLHPHTKNKGERKNLLNSKFLSIRVFIPSFYLPFFGPHICLQTLSNPKKPLIFFHYSPNRLPIFTKPNKIKIKPPLTP